MKTIAIINRRGGVGKSTTAAALGAGLSLKGQRVLYIDLDPQCNLSLYMGAEYSGLSSKSALQVLNRSAKAEDTIQRTERGDIIASSPALAGADLSIIATGKEYRLKKALEPISSHYDYCVIDTPPALGILTVNALTACNGCIIPAQAEIWSLQGIGQLWETIQEVKEYCNPELKVLGILITRYNGRAIISRDYADLLAEQAKAMESRVYTSKIRECTAIKESQAVQQSIYEYSPRSNAAQDYKAFVEEVMSNA